MVPDDQLPGGGSGGGPDNGSEFKAFDGTYMVTANQVLFLSRPPMPPAAPSNYVITLLATGMGMGGLVNIGASQGVRITAGPPPLPAVEDSGTNGVEVMVGEMQNVTIKRGLLPIDQSIEMTPSGITVDAGTGEVTIKSLTKITLSVAEGIATIELTPTGIKVQGLMVNIN